MSTPTNDLDEREPASTPEAHSETWRPDANARATSPVADGAMKPSGGNTTPNATRTLRQNLGTSTDTEPIRRVDRSDEVRDPQREIVSMGTLGPTGDEMRDHDFPEVHVGRDQQNQAVAVSQEPADPGAFEEGGAIGTRPGDVSRVGTVGAILDQAETSPNMEQSIDGYLP